MTDYLEPIVSFIAVAVLVCLSLIYKGIDRKLSARLQSRYGPPIIQPIFDVQKLMVKESIVPRNAIPWMFNGAPIVALASALLIMLYLPIGSFDPVLDGYGDLILIIYLLTLPSLAMAMGGFASNSPYATVGAQREIVMMMSYELPLATVVVALAWRISVMQAGLTAFSMDTIQEFPLWQEVGGMGVVGLFLLLLALMIVFPAEVAKIPFDAPEAETEIAGGLLVEYSGRNLAMFYLADAVRTVVVATLVITLFFPYGLSGPMGYIDQGSPIGNIVDFLFHLVKLFIVMFIGVTVVRTATARLKIDQISRLYWGYTAMLSVVGLLLLWMDYTL